MAEAFFSLGRLNRVGELLARVRELPQPFADAPTTPSFDLLETSLRCGVILEDLFQALPESARLRARLELPEDALRRLGTTRPDPTELPTDPDGFALLRVALGTGAPELGRAAVLRLLALIEQAWAAPEQPRNAATLGRGTLEGVAEGARYLSEDELTRAVDITWHMLRARTKGPTAWQVLSVLCSLLRAHQSTEQIQKKRELLAYASEHPELAPPLPEITGWELLFDEGEQRAYLSSWLQHWGMLRAL